MASMLFVCYKCERNESQAGQEHAFKNRLQEITDAFYRSVSFGKKDRIYTVSGRAWI
nr:hypothetical protein [Mucilaginibacter sp. X5P1]